MMVMTLPWHYLGLQGQWRRVATFNYADPIIAAWGPWVIVSLAWAAHPARQRAPVRLEPARIPPRAAPCGRASSRSTRSPCTRRVRVPASLNGFALWNVLVLVLMLAAYGYPIAQFFWINPPAGDRASRRRER